MTTAIETVRQLIDSDLCRVFWLDLTSPHSSRDGTFRVSIVFEGNDGHYPTGCVDTDSWYLDARTCAAMNRHRGYGTEEVDRIVASSMLARGA